jgi:hypothetical protein
VCIDKCFNQALGFAGEIGALSQDACGPTELCVACSMIKLGVGSDIKVPGCS